MDAYNSVIEIIDALKNVSFSLGSAKLNLYLVLQGLLAIIMLPLVVRFIINRLERRLIRMRDLRPSNRALIVKILQIIFYIFTFLLTLQILGINLAAFSVIGGALGVGIGFGLQKISSNFISGIILLFEKSVEVDDLIELADGTQGFIRTISARYTRIEATDGRDVIIPNEDFITQRVVSLTHSNKRARIELNVTVHFESDVSLALRVLCESAERVVHCSQNPPPMAHIIAFGDYGVKLALYFWVDDLIETKLDARTQAWLNILESFRTNGIRIPYPTREMIHANGATDD
jgi:small-conductance mechanosensitive channel